MDLMHYVLVMTRGLLPFASGSLFVAYLDPLGYRWAGFAGLCVVAVVILLLMARHGRRSIERRTIEGLRRLRPDDFEAEVGRWLRRDGWQIEHRGGTGDGGIDLVARKRAEVLAIQCKRYAEHAAVSAAQVRDLYGAAIATGATSAVLVTTAHVSAHVLAWAESLNEGPALVFHDFRTLGAMASGSTRF